MNKHKLWFPSFNGRYEANEPVYSRYESNEPEVYPAEKIEIAKELEHNYPAILEELNILWSQDNNIMDTYGGFNTYDNVQFPPNSWKKIVFRVWGIRNKTICEKFPFTASLIEKFQNVTSCFVTKLSAHSIIRPHGGETNAQLRIHLGLNVPEEDAQCGIEVNNQKVFWKNGKAFAFLDAYHHHAWNNSDNDRYVLIVDVLRPKFLNKMNFIYSRVIVSQILTSASKKLNSDFFLRMHNAPATIIAYILYLPIIVILKLNNKLGFINL